MTRSEIQATLFANIDRLNLIHSSLVLSIFANDFNNSGVGGGETHHL